MVENDEPRWLSPEQQGVWRSWLLAVARIEDYLDRDLRRFGLALAEYEIMVRLSEADDWSLRMSQLADDVHQTRSRLTHTISRMEKEGIVSRRSAPDDRRGVLAQLTEKGYDSLVAAAPAAWPRSAASSSTSRIRKTSPPWDVRSTPLAVAD